VAAEPEKVVERWPTLARQLRTALTAQTEPGLAAQVDELRVHEVCPCDDDFCQSFYTQPPPDEGFGPGHRNVVLEPEWDGHLIIDVIDGQIVFIEVLDRSPLD
jgi:hypothetical protein